MLDVQVDLRRRLATAFPDSEVKRFMPQRVPKRLITIRREGGRRHNSLIDGPGVGIYCFAESEQETSELASDVADFMETLAFCDGYAAVDQESMYSSPDPDTKRFRWYLSYTIKTYQPKG